MRGDRRALAAAARPADADRIGQEDQPRGRRRRGLVLATASAPSSSPRFKRAPSTTWTRRSSAWRRPKCRCRTPRCMEQAALPKAQNLIEAIKATLDASGYRARTLPLMAEVTMPRLSDTMEEGTIASWLKKPGEQITQGRSDRPDRDRQSDDGPDGVRGGHAAGDPGARRHDGRHRPARSAHRQRRPPPAAEATAAPAPKADRRPADAHAAPSAKADAAPAEAAPPRAAEAARRRPKAEPRRAGAQSAPRRRRPPTRTRARMAKRAPRRWRATSPPSTASISPRISGSGPQGRVIRADVEAALERHSQPPAASSRSAAAGPAAAPQAEAAAHRRR